MIWAQPVKLMTHLPFHPLDDDALDVPERHDGARDEEQDPAGLEDVPVGGVALTQSTDGREAPEPPAHP